MRTRFSQAFGKNKALMEKYNIVPERAVFIDDREENVQAARALGIKGIVFENYEQARRELESAML